MAQDVYLTQLPPERARELFEGELVRVGWPGGGRPPEAAVAVELVAVARSAHRVCAQPVTAELSSPHYHAAAMDGVAVRAAETFAASEQNPVVLALGTDAVPIDTGDPLPDGYDAVIMVESLVRRGADTVTIIAPAVPWQHVRTLGEDIVAGDVIVPRGRLIGAWDVGAMVAAGVERVPVVRRPRVLIIPTGDEVVPAGTLPRRGEVIDSNSHMIGALVEEWGGEAVAHPVVPDRLEAIVQAIAEACDPGCTWTANHGGSADIICTIAGTSAGREDYAAEAVRRLGKVVAHGVAMRPGKPTLLGVVAGRPFLGLPGYPVSCALACELFLRPLIARFLGVTFAPRPSVKVTMAVKCPSSAGVEEFVRVRVARIRGRYVATPLARAAGSTTSLIKADAWVRLPPQCQGVEQGEEVTAELVRPLGEIDRALMVVGSHDPALDVLADHLARLAPGLMLSSAHVGSLGGLLALRFGHAHMAGTHLLDPETRDYNISYIRRTLGGLPVTLVCLAWRVQGLMVAPGNPKGITELADLSRPDVVMVNRQRGAGTRVLLDLELERLGVSPRQIAGYDRELYTHTAVAAAVANGVADVGLGVYSAARALGLDFIPVCKERYDLAIPTELVSDPLVEAALETLRTEDFKRALEGLGGYDVSETGNVVWRGA